MLSDTDKTEYTKIVEDLHTIARRLAHLADCGFSDMEGADMPEFQISEELWWPRKPSPTDRQHGRSNRYPH